MAGSYPDVPGHRIEYDRDGSTAIWLAENLADLGDTLTPTQLQEINDDEHATNVVPSGNGDDESWLCIIFPQTMDLQGAYVDLRQSGSSNNSQPWYLQWSADTTNGQDGTWTEDQSGVGGGVNGIVYGRTMIVGLALTSVRGVRIKHQGDVMRVRQINLYGSPSTTTDRLDIWHPTLDERLGPAAMDWGDDPQGHTETAQFRVKNLSASLTANSIELARESLAHAEFQTAHQFSADDTTYTDTLNIGNLAPGAISSVLYIRKTYTASQPVGLARARIVTTTGSWS